MIVKQRENRSQMEIFSIEEFVPEEHLLRKIDNAIDFTHIYDIVEELYCADNGRPSIDPAVIFKNGVNTASVRIAVPEKNGRRNKDECSIPLVSGIFNE
ncbi:MAG: hypothetical protein L6V89_06410 [Oscillospiraceae bacterium]|nr:MAG: hypothetical protein L6V89_06410 [Oscillospiraceae bacterium]